MSKLRSPLRLELDDPPSEQEVQRVWAGVQRRRVRRQARVGLRTAASMAAAAAICVTSLLLLLSRLTPSAPGAALTASGQPLGQLVTAPAGAVDLSDGSRIELGPKARLEILDNSSRAFGTALRAGRALFDVRPGGPRRWTIEAGLASVEVVGTRFTVSRGPHAVEVAVARGVVVVRGDNVPDHVRRLTAGETLTVRERDPEPASATLEAANAADRVGPPAPDSKPGASTPSSSGSAKPLGFDELLAAADAQRRRGDFRGAEASLKSVLASAPDGKRAALAAFTLGKLELDNLGNPGQAAAAFAHAVSLGPPAAIAEDAFARLVEAEGRAGELQKARDDARLYQKRYPNGQRSYAVHRWLELP